MIEDRRAVLGTNIVALAVERCRVMNGKKYFEQLFIGDLLRVKCHLNYLGVTGGSTTHQPVRGIGEASAGIARDRFDHAFELGVNRFQAPETAACQGGDFRYSSLGGRIRHGDYANLPSTNNMDPSIILRLAGNSAEPCLSFPE
jgi:hypothetical protein